MLGRSRCVRKEQLLGLHQWGIKWHTISLTLRCSVSSSLRKNQRGVKMAWQANAKEATQLAPKSAKPAHSCDGREPATPQYMRSLVSSTSCKGRKLKDKRHGGDRGTRQGREINYATRSGTGWNPTTATHEGCDAWVRILHQLEQPE